MSANPLLSIVLATHNRCDVVLHTLRQIQRCGIDASDYEVMVVDNASEDGTPEALAGQTGVVVHRLDRNVGSCAKAYGVERARGEFILFLDDDSYPRAGCVERMLRHFVDEPDLGAAGFMVHLTDGTQECSALPHAFVGCGVGFRATALRAVGGLDATFFMQAEEYDLSWRLLHAGWKVEIFGDLHVEHAKSPLARRSERTTYYDVCNNLRVIARYLPEPYLKIYRQDWLQRYAWLAERAGHVAAYERGVEAGVWYAQSERDAHRKWRLTPEVLETVFAWALVERRMTQLAEAGVRRIVLADLGKNVHAFWRGAEMAGLDVLAIADDRFSGHRREYRGVPVCTVPEALGMGADALVVSNTSYVHAEQRRRALADGAPCPVHRWFEPPPAVASASGRFVPADAFPPAFQAMPGPQR